MLQKINQFFKKERVLVIAAVFAVFTMFLVKPSKAYIGYLDFRVLALLFSLMAVVAGLQKNGVFLRLSERLLLRVKSVRSMCYVLILLCFFSSMWITNDVALITFVPFAVLMLKLTGRENDMIYVIVMQTIAANLGSMLTPVGNPQNLYLYSFYHLKELDFFGITVPYVLFSFIILSLISLIIKKEPINQLDYSAFDQKTLQSELNVKAAGIDVNPLTEYQTSKGNILHIVMLAMLFLLCLGTVMHLIDYRLTLGVVIFVIGILDRKIFGMVDYSLLLTFVCFFIFSGNLGNVKAINLFISKAIESREVLASILLSQIISNVPAAVLLSNFTKNAEHLIIGTNLGGLGTIIASLASLISYRIYLKTEKPLFVKYLVLFTLANVGILILLVMFFMFLPL
ncbi:SLC13 family permease [Anaerocolumna sp. AGMB13025]|uniref:SLC13 family permease n=1 Tax=Anaerocolumna sp. AGMB13025 TaxID=3039116 RepID=UPI00241EAB50|nr:SLC13 family permease [Anaerocolumna sp. AGMB13025]WFR59702.1 SLC13 family permease [Anaerocolumna sp. AGMB13025]